jgi:hypothetical protein
MFSLLFVGNVFFVVTTRKTFLTNNKENISYKQQRKHFLQTTKKTFPTNNKENIVGNVFLVVCKKCFPCC